MLALAAGAWLASCGGGGAGASTPAQNPVVADFQADTVSGVAPLRVAFEDRSSGAPNAWSWDFGDGGTSNAQDPTHDYVLPGRYAVGLAVSGPQGADALLRADLVEVLHPPPTAAFALGPGSGPAPLTVTFADLSTGTVSAWSWDFGDGEQASVASPVHIYSFPGTFTVTLEVRGPGGVTSHAESGAVVVPAPPGAAFAATPLAGVVPLRVSFTDLSTGDPFRFTWDFGDGASSNEASPLHEYVLPGTYRPRLTVEGPGGTASTPLDTSIEVREPAPRADFTLSPMRGNVPLAVDFLDRSSGPITARSWDFGDGSGSSASSPTHTYTRAGTYDVTLSVRGPGGTDQHNVPGAVEVLPPPPVASFGRSPDTGAAPLAVFFVDTSVGSLTQWDWNFGDGGRSTLQHPTHVYLAAGSQDVTLTVAGPGGSDVVVETDSVLVVPPVEARFVQRTRGADRPLYVRFEDRSLGEVSAWDWDFGDGAGSTLRHPAHTYTRAGAYDVRLSVSGPFGADSTVHVGAVLVEASAACPAPANPGYTRFANQVPFAGAPCPGRCVDVYVPNEPRPCLPTVLFVHGGGWSGGSKQDAANQQWAATLAADGVPVVVANYQLATFDPCGSGAGQGSFPEAVMDLKRVVSWIRDSGAGLFALPPRVVAVGSSAGAHLVSLLGTTQGPDEALFDPGGAGSSSDVERVFAFAPATNLVAIGCRGNPWTSPCDLRCPGAADPPADCTYLPGCVNTGGYPPGYPCLGESGGCRGFEAPEVFLGRTWSAASPPSGVDCADPLRVPGGLGELPTGNPWYDASPLFWVSGDEPPFHLFHGQCDALIPSAESVALHQALEAVGVPVDLTLEGTVTSCDRGCQHGLFGLYGTAGAAQLVRDRLLALYAP